MSHWMLYSHDALGLGHVRRMLSIAGAVLPERPDLSALLVTCSPQVDALPVPPGLDYVKLPSARKLSAHQYVSRSLRLDPAQLSELRATLIADTARVFQPDLLLADKSPMGMMGELEPALQLLHECRAGLGRRGAPIPRLVLGWRDILDAPARVRAEWHAKGTLEAIERWYDEVWIYGDPDVFDLRSECAMPDRIAERVRFLGYLAPRVEPAARARARAQLGDGQVALVTAGGGEDGEALLGTWIESARRGLLPDGLRSVVVTGPFLPVESHRRLAAGAPDSVSLVPFLPGLEAHIAAADLVVGMAGYNTACEVLGAGTPAVLSPRASQRDEQRLRAERLSTRGWIESVVPEQLTPGHLADAARRALSRGRRLTTMTHADGPSLGGLEAVARQLERLLPQTGLSSVAEFPLGLPA